MNQKRVNERQKKAEELLLERHKASLLELERQRERAREQAREQAHEEERLRLLEAQRQKEKEQNGLLFAKKMRQLKAMIDKRTKEKIAWLKECEDETLLSKKTSFSSFYNLEDDVQRVDSSERN